jgi:hypothetical protein
MALISRQRFEPFGHQVRVVVCGGQLQTVAPEL